MEEEPKVKVKKLYFDYGLPVISESDYNKILDSLGNNPESFKNRATRVAPVAQEKSVQTTGEIAFLSAGLSGDPLGLSLYHHFKNEDTKLMSDAEALVASNELMSQAEDSGGEGKVFVDLHLLKLAIHGMLISNFLAQVVMVLKAEPGECAIPDSSTLKAILSQEVLDNRQALNSAISSFMMVLVNPESQREIRDLEFEDTLEPVNPEVADLKREAEGNLMELRGKAMTGRLPPMISAVVTTRQEQEAAGEDEKEESSREDKAKKAMEALAAKIASDPEALLQLLARLKKLSPLTSEN